ncbi:hypothetical protein M0805_002554 [Coniferiporia weirii]|nr:hypothetical protein M0805_002554 [Coniferiporia weirii]
MVRHVSRLLQGHNHQNFFTYDDGHPIKFRIQPGFNISLRTRLMEDISTNGGVVMTKIPINGIVVVDPNSCAGRKLVRNWSWTERPARYFVSYVFIQRCIDEKKLLPLVEHALISSSIQNMQSTTHPELPEIAKEKLALYLAKIMPYPSSGNRSSNKIYQRLVKNRVRFPWIKDHDWQTYRNQYCKNKRYYDKLIEAIVDDREESSSCKLPTAVKGQRLRMGVGHSAPVSERLVLRANTVADKGARLTDAVVERKRRFADDITNVNGSVKLTKLNSNSKRSVDGMLRASPSLIVTKKRASGELPGKKTHLTAQDTEEVEVCRATTKFSEMGTDVWVNENFRDDGWDMSINARTIDRRDSTKADDSKKILGSNTCDLYQHSLTSYGMDLDDFCSAAALGASAMNNEDVETEDEKRVIELLELPSDQLGPVVLEHPTYTASNKEPTRPTTSLIITTFKKPHGDHKLSAVQDLAQNTRFTLEEVQQKLTSFSSDFNKTHDFFSRCRQAVDSLFTWYINDGRAASAPVALLITTTPTMAVGLSDQNPDST